METKRSNIKPLVIFFLLSCLLAWGLMGLFIAQNHGWVSPDIPFEPFLILGSWVPNIAAFLVIAFVLKRKGGIRQLLKGWLKFKVPAFWYLVAITPVIFAVLSMFIYKLLYGVTPVSEIVFDPMSMLALLIISTITGATGEELGWRGFALPGLQMRMSAFNASLVLGVIWTLWHVPLWFAGLGYEKIPFTAYAILVMSYTVLITWACNNSGGSMVIVTLFHLMMNVAMNILEIQAFFVYALLVLAITVLVVLLYGPSKLSKAPELPIDKETGEWLAQ
ncbi:MAG: CPBP family intramembrane metalloprotease [Bacteroidetes bacterium]|nr:MAG: CPBP family intramembrane metalloprotease [Bacteroidota bacterium]